MLLAVSIIIAYQTTSDGLANKVEEAGGLIAGIQTDMIRLYQSLK